MPWDGSGTFERTDDTRTGADVWRQARDANVDVNAPDHDSHDEDLAEGIENCVARDGQNSPTGNLPMATHRHTGCGDAEADDEYATFGQLERHSPLFVPAASVGGTANAITLAPTPAATEYATGRGYRFVVEAANTGAVTVAVSALAAASIRRPNGDELAAGDLSVGQVLTIIHNGTHFRSNAGGAGGVDSDAVNALIAAADLDASKLASGTVAAARLAASPSKDEVLTINSTGVAVWQDPFLDSAGALWVDSADGALICRFAEPASASAIQRRQIRGRNATTGQRIPIQNVTGSPARIDGLVNGNRYELWTRFQNGNGWGNTSPVVSATPAPAFHKVDTAGSTTFLWPWSEQSALVILRSGGHGGQASVPGTVSSVTFGSSSVTSAVALGPHRVADTSNGVLTGLSVGSSLSIVVGAASDSQANPANDAEDGLVYIVPV